MITTLKGAVFSCHWRHHYTYKSWYIYIGIIYIWLYMYIKWSQSPSLPWITAIIGKPIRVQHDEQEVWSMVTIITVIMDPFFLCLHFVPSHVYSSSELFAWWFWILQTMHSNLGNTWDDKNKPTNMFGMEAASAARSILVGDLPWYFFSLQWTMLHQSDVHMILAMVKTTLRRLFFSLGGNLTLQCWSNPHPKPSNANTAWMCYGFTTWISSVHQESIRVNGWVG